MRKLFLVLYMAVCIIMCGCSLGQVRTSSGDEYTSGETYMILYFKENNESYLVPESRMVDISGRRMEEVIVEELIKGPQTPGLIKVMPTETKLASVKVKSKTAYVNLRMNIDSNTKLSQWAIGSIVNSITELPYITSVRIYIEGKPYGSIFKRERAVIKREQLTPSQVMEKQMTLEKSGDWMNAYILMSDSEKSRGRKSYNEYIKELEDVKKEGLLNADFKVGEYTIDPLDKNLSSVKVNFIVTNSDGSTYKSPDVFFSCVKIDGYWRVDWLTGQSL